MRGSLAKEPRLALRGARAHVGARAILRGACGSRRRRVLVCRTRASVTRVRPRPERVEQTSGRASRERREPWDTDERTKVEE